jgi:hypothetical protein
VRQVVDVTRDVLRNVSEFFQAQLKNPKSDIFIFTAVVLHQRGANKNVVLRSVVFSRAFKHGSGGLDTFRASSKLHVLNVRLKTTLKQNGKARFTNIPA